jgi:hypothetical protein
MTELETFVKMLQSSGTRYMEVQDPYDAPKKTVTVENLPMKNGPCIDVVFQFRNKKLRRVWAREG